MPRLLAIVAALAALATGAAPAGANSGQRTIVQDDAQLLKSGAEVRTRTLDEIKALGVEIVKVTVNWREIAPGGSSRPTSFDGADPAAYPVEKWAPYDAVVAGAQARGLEVFMQTGARAPDWASGRPGRCGPKPCPAGSTRPSPVEFGQFMTAVGRRYSGSYSDPRVGGQLPRVGTWSVWNEPNLGRWLAPKSLGGRRSKTLISPALYRGLFLAAHRALSSTGHMSDAILLGELLPFKRAGDATAPLEFLRELACVDKRFRPYRGRAARVRGCARFRALPGTGLAYHPYTHAGGPRAYDAKPDEAEINHLGQLTATLDRLGKGRRLRVRRMPVWITEFGFQTNPPDPFQAPISRVPGYMGESEWLAFRNRRVVAYSQYPLVDDRSTNTGFGQFDAWQAGLRFADGKPKRLVYEAFRYPFFVRLVSASKVEVFGGVRAASGGEGVVVESGSGRNFTAVRGGSATLGRGGYFRKVLRVRGAARKRFRFRLRDETSRATRPTRRPAP